jgi:hypothetical protein
MQDVTELIERARRRLVDRDLPCAIAGGAPEDAIAAAEEAVGCSFPPSYRTFLARHGMIALPARVSTIQQFVGLGHATNDNDDGKGVVERTLHARVENRLPEALVIVGLGVEPGEWFCLDTARPRSDGECPILLFDARDNALDQQFYDDFGQMLEEVLTFVVETLEELSELSQGDHPLAGRLAHQS